MSSSASHRVALLWYGDQHARQTARLEDNRLHGVAEALRRVSIVPEPAVYAPEHASQVLDQLLRVDGVLVWVNPIEEGRDRFVLDAMLREVAAQGILVSAHPEVILKMGTKEVLFRTRQMSWGCDVNLYATFDEFREHFPSKLAQEKPRVLKQCRGNGGNGVWKVELLASVDSAYADGHPRAVPDAATPVRVRHALRGAVEEVIPLGEFVTRCEPYFSASGGLLVDQAWQERLTQGTVRVYVVGNRVAGFGHQQVNALFPAPLGAAPSEAPCPGPRLYYPATRPDLQALRAQMETEWIPDMQRVLGLEPAALPVLWDADFLYGPPSADRRDSWVLCEINVSSVFPFPDSALEVLARETRARLDASSQLRAARFGACSH